MALYQGESGKISIKKNSGTVQYIVHATNWSMDSSMEVESTPYFGGSATEEGFTESVPGVISWTSGLEGSMDFAASGGQDVLFEAHNNSEAVEITLYLDAESGFKGTGYISSYSATHAAEGKAEFSAEITGNGKIQKFTV